LARALRAADADAWRAALSAAAMAPKAKAAKAKATPKAASKRAAAEVASGEAKRRKADGEAPNLDAAPPAIDTAETTSLLVQQLRDSEWAAALAPEFGKPYFGKIAEFVAAERAAHAVHPPLELTFAAFNETPLSGVRVVILGQDPYHEPGQAHGMCFSVLPGTPPPPSLKNMYKELETDIDGFKAPSHGYLVPWAKQGVLLLNATLTVREGHANANSHAKCGWQTFTDEVIRVLNARLEGVVFLLWGGFAQKKGKIVDTSRHRVIACAHPSPLSFRKWQGCKTFSRCNEELRKLGRAEIDWSLA